jgi:hypothetical protein
MDDAELKALLTAGAPPARDPAFELAVLRRIEQRRFRVAVASNLALALGATLLLALLSPLQALLSPLLENIWRVSLAPLASNLVVGVVVLATALVALQLQPRQD